MNRSTCWGIFREKAHSPGRESDDAEILRLTAAQLEARGFRVELKDPDDLGAAAGARPSYVFLMCERPAVMRELRAWETAGARLVNSPQAVLNTYREQMIAQFAEANVPFIPSRLVATAGEGDPGPFPVWVKRADVHNTQEGDVVFATSPEALEGALAGLAERGIARAVLQQHVEGDLIKFYGVGPGGGHRGEPPWFRWCYHKDQRLAGHAFDQTRLAKLVRRAAGALGLEIYGGDVIVTPAGQLVLLDLNAWPSFALYRDEAAPAIAGYLALRFRRSAR